jgi:hypothetical protein
MTNEQLDEALGRFVARVAGHQFGYSARADVLIQGRCFATSRASHAPAYCDGARGRPTPTQAFPRYAMPAEHPEARRRQHLLSAVIDSRTAREPLRYGSKPFSGIHLLGVWCGWQRGGWEPIRAFLYLLPGRSRALERGAALTGARHLAGGDPCDLCSS